MEIKFYNSMSNTLEEFKPLHEGKVSMYVCGPTVYNYPHIGNMRPVVVFDTLRRFLTYVGYDVTYVSNFTDVDDKIIKEAKNKNTTEKELTEFYIGEFRKATSLIGSMNPNITPKVTEYMQSIIKYVEELVKLDAAYVVDNDVYFRVSKIKDYGSLSGINIDDLIVGARIEENSFKDNERTIMVVVCPPELPPASIIKGVKTAKIAVWPMIASNDDRIIVENIWRII